MTTGKMLLEHYREVLNHNNVNYKLCVITNGKAKEGGILLVGMNPSGDGGKELFDYLDEECKYGDFWEPKHKMMGRDDSKNNFDNKCGFIDLFPIRNGDQKDFEKNNYSNNQMMGQLLGVTQDYIESLRPKLIISANKRSSYYWGFKKQKKEGPCKPFEDEYDNIWMGYEFERVKPSPLAGIQDKGYWDFYKITNIIPSGVNKWRQTTNLEGSFYLQYRQHKAYGNVVRADRELTPNDIKTIVEWIDPKWVKDLL